MARASPAACSGGVMSAQRRRPASTSARPRPRMRRKASLASRMRSPSTIDTPRMLASNRDRKRDSLSARRSARSGAAPPTVIPGPYRGKMRKVPLRATFFALERNECAGTAHEEGQMDGLFRRRFAHWVVVAVVALGAATAAVALGATPASNIAANNFATGFASAHSIGPIGIAFDGAGDLFTVDRQHLYRFGSGG